MQRFGEQGRSFRHCGGSALGVTVALVTVAVLMAGIFAQAAPPRQELLGPDFSFDAESPSVLDGSFGAADVLGVPNNADGSNNHRPRLLIPGMAIGLPGIADDLNATSSSHAGVAPTSTFSILFSVDRETVGVAQPDDVLVGFQAGYNATHQALVNQQSGDQYMTIDLFTRQGQVPGAVQRAPTENNSLLRNNGDEGGTDFGAVPDTSAEEDNSGEPQDNVDTMTNPGTAARGTGEPGLYFSVREGTVGQGLPGEPIPANLYYDSLPSDPASQIDVFASAQQLGLTPADDINAVIVFDDGALGFLDDGDQVLFSLTRGSPSLATLPGSGEGPAADIFSITIGAPSATPVLFASAATLGLGAPLDNVDALEFFFCDNGHQCAELYSIRRMSIPTTSEWGVVAMLLLMLIGGSVVFARRSAAA